MRYGFVAVAKNEFQDLPIHCTSEQRCASGFNGNDVITIMGFDDKGSVAENAGILFGEKRRSVRRSCM